MNANNQSGNTVNQSAPQLADTPAKALRLLVIGGTRGIGLETVKLALDRGHTVTVLARQPEHMKVTDPKLTTIEGDVRDASAVQQAVSNQDAVAMAIGMGLTRQPVTLFSAGTKVVLDAMEAAGIRRLVAVTGMGAGDTREHGGFFYDRIFRPLALQTVYDDKDRQEALIRERTGSFPLVWTIPRPGMLSNGASKQQYRVLTELTGIAGGKITRADVAHFVVAVIENGSHAGESPLLIY
ncbi:MAG: SDR family oxidoreductase [Gammaproteobacteria bacterium]|jgi:putative NADH-flavin reductase|nr:SDR family oxidoreductase [Gammaproteobacteria bacterium]MDP6617081.1 SDR family oxidoreductase [Gammaproteobacteria bacterium]